MLTENYLPSRKTLAELNQAESALQRALHTVKAINASVSQMQSIDTPDEVLVVYANLLVRERKNRHHYFPDFTFGEPVWDILLDLYIARCTGKLISVSSACIAAGVPPTTGLRYVTMMTHESLIERSADPSDFRKVYVSLSDHMHDTMRKYLMRTSQECLCAT
jgi:DNA-binding MarR family transcriptional regulator